MRKDVAGTARKHVLVTKGFGLRKARKGGRFRRTVAGNTVGYQTAQVNLKITTKGTAKLGPEGAEAPKEEPKDKPKVAKKEVPKESPKEEPKK